MVSDSASVFGSLGVLPLEQLLAIGYCIMLFGYAKFMLGLIKAQSGALSDDVEECR